MEVVHIKKYNLTTMIDKIEEPILKKEVLITPKKIYQKSPSSGNYGYYHSSPSLGPTQSASTVSPTIS